VLFDVVCCATSLNLDHSVLRDVSLSISTYLDDDSHPYHQAVATELCSRGFGIWQNYVDAMGLVRQIFGLATGRNPSTPSELRNLARQATLHVAGVNTPLFMTTLLFDILNAPSALHRNATLKLLGFMIRKVCRRRLREASKTADHLHVCCRNR
jgi:hypothetical protein